MPFQNATSSKRIVVSDITLVTAGVDQTDICSPTVTLSATVVGSPTGHVFLWEQQSGGAVVIDDDSAITTFYTVAAPGRKIFRFYIDKGTASEQFDDITVDDTPAASASSFSAPASGVGVAPVIAGPEGFPVTEAFGNVVNEPENPPAQLHGEGLVISTFTLTWNHPGQVNDAFITQYNVIEAATPVFNVNVVELLPTASGVPPLGPPGDAKLFDTGAITTYEINAKYNFHGNAFDVNSAVFDFSSIVVDPVAVIDDALDGGWSNPDDGATTSIDFIRFSTQLVQVPTDTYEGGFSHPAEEVGTSITFVRFSAFVLETAIDTYEGGFSQLEGTNGVTASFTRFDPSGIGGGGG